MKKSIKTLENSRNLSIGDFLSNYQKKMKSIVFTLVALIGFTSAVIFDRPCRLDEMRPRVKQNFNVAAYTGLWYEIESYETQGQLPLDCVEARYTALPAGNVEVFNSGWTQGGRQVRLTGSAAVSEEGAATNRAMLDVLFRLEDRTPSIYWIMSTDYTNYAVVWSCFNIGSTRSQETFWVLSRDKVPSPAVRENIDRVLTENSAVRSSLRPNIQDINVCMTDRRT
jgi:lipocalin